MKFHIVLQLFIYFAKKKDIQTKINGRHLWTHDSRLNFNDMFEY